MRQFIIYILTIWKGILQPQRNFLGIANPKVQNIIAHVLKI